MKKKMLLFALAAVSCMMLAAFVGCAEEIGEIIDDKTPDITQTTPTAPTTKTYTITFVKDGNTVFETNVAENSKVEEYILKDAPFNCWYYNGKEYDFNAPVTSGMLLTAVNAKTFDISFIADGDVVDVLSYTYESVIEEPPVPDKDYYEGEWGKYELTGGDIEVTAVYTPIVYNLTYYLDDTQFETTCTVENPPENIPEVPFRQAYEGNWKYVADGKNVTVKAEYTPIDYNINFYIDNVLYATAVANIENAVNSYPEYSERLHYTSEWEDFDFSSNPIDVNLIFMPIDYFVRFYCDGELYAEISYNVENTQIDEPSVPEKQHYNGEWTEYELISGDVEVNAVYILKEYDLNFCVDGEVYKSYKYNIDTVTVDPPEIPQKIGYTAKWEDFFLTGGNVVVNAVYEPILEGTAGLIYTLNKANASYTVTGYDGMDSKVFVPPFYNNLPVTAIGESAFREMRISSIEISEGITSLGENVFLDCVYLSSVRLPQTLEEIPRSAFAYCSELKFIKIPFGVKTICEQALYNSGIETIELPDSLERIEKRAFYYCDKLTEVTIHDSVLYIGEDAFRKCVALKKITIGVRLNFVDINAFYECNSLVEAYFKDPNNWIVQGKDNSDLIRDVSEFLVSPDEAAFYLVGFTDKYLIKN